MEFGIAVYDALVAANIAPEKARAVVTSMEKDMQDRLATKADIEALRQANKADIDSLRLATQADFASVRKDLKHGLETLSKDMTIKLGSMFVVAVGIIIAAVKLLH